MRLSSLLRYSFPHSHKSLRISWYVWWVRLVYSLLTKKQAYVEQGLEEFGTETGRSGLCFAKPENWGISW